MSCQTKSPQLNRWAFVGEKFNNAESSGGDDGKFTSENMDQAQHSFESVNTRSQHAYALFHIILVRDSAAAMMRLQSHNPQQPFRGKRHRSPSRMKRDSSAAHK
jgi:hypothetical protein